jgi:hypothetical protein
MREKHQAEIINYKRRSQAGKTIGSGRVEKGVHLTGNPRGVQAPKFIYGGKPQANLFAVQVCYNSYNSSTEIIE